MYVQKTVSCALGRRHLSNNENFYQFHHSFINNRPYIYPNLLTYIHTYTLRQIPLIHLSTHPRTSLPTYLIAPALFNSQQPADSKTPPPDPPPP